jgi:hypothetical protein
VALTKSQRAHVRAAMLVLAEERVRISSAIDGTFTEGIRLDVYARNLKEIHDNLARLLEPNEIKNLEERAKKLVAESSKVKEGK